MKPDEIKVGDILLVPCVVTAVHPQDDLYPVKVEIPRHKSTVGPACWLHSSVMKLLQRAPG
jgi:hypothetical protein